MPKTTEATLIMLRTLSFYLLLACSSALAAPPKDYSFTSFDEGLRVAKAQNKRMFVYFGRYGCAWCEQVNLQTFVDLSLRELYTRNYVLVYVDAESGKRLRLPSGERVTEAELGVRYQAFGTPMFIYLEADGTLIASIPGVQTVQNFIDYDRFVMGGHYRTQSLLEFLRVVH